MDKEFIKKNNLMESVKRFHQILEYTNAAGAFSVNEAGEDDPNAMPQDPNMDMGGAPGMDAGMGGDPNGMPQDPNMDGADPNGMPQDPNMDGADPNMGAGPEGFAPQVPQGADPMAMPEGEEEEEEEVIDVDELTDAQEKTEDKLDKLSDKFEKLLNKIDNFEAQIDHSNEKMEALKAEIEKRNPTPVEKLSLRTRDSYPFSLTPGEYWKDKEQNSNYSTEDDENGANDRIYQITKDEIDDFNDYASVSKTFDDYDIRNMFGY